MTRKCSVPKCITNKTNILAKGTPVKVPVFCFPVKDKSALQTWVDSLPNKLSVEQVTKYMGVCALHWPPDAPVIRRGRHFVPTVAPSIFYNVSNASVSIRKNSGDIIQTGECHQDVVQAEEYHEHKIQDEEYHEDKIQAEEYHEDVIQAGDHHGDVIQAEEYHEHEIQDEEYHEDKIQAGERHGDIKQAKECHEDKIQTEEWHGYKLQAEEYHGYKIQAEEYHGDIIQTGEYHGDVIQVGEHHGDLIQAGKCYNLPHDVPSVIFDSMNMMKCEPGHVDLVDVIKEEQGFQDSIHVVEYKPVHLDFVDTLKCNLEQDLVNQIKKEPEPEDSVDVPIIGLNRSDTLSKIYQGDDMTIPIQQTNRTTVSPDEESNMENEMTDIYWCDLCSLAFKTKVSLDNHTERQHWKKKTLHDKLVCLREEDRICRTLMANRVKKKEPFKCKDCGQTFDEKICLQNHMKRHRRERKMCKCDVCGKMLSKKSTLKSHTMIHTGEKPFQCTECNKTFRISGELAKHMRRHTRNSVSCEKCYKSFYAMNSLRAHMRMHTGEKPYTCNECGKKFAWKSGLNSHLSKTHRGDKPFQCDVCGNRYGHSTGLKRHLLTHTLDTPYLCSVCGKGYRYDYAFKMHMQMHKEGKQSSGISRHPLHQSKRIYKPTTEKQYRCSMCGVAFGAKYALRTHFYIHTGERPHRCAVCYKGFRSNVHMKLHMKIHTEEMQFRCKYCEQKFRHGSSLTLHVRKLHTGETPYCCKECDKTYYVSSSYAKHMKKKHNARGLYKCKKCYRSFVTNSSLSMHSCALS